MGVDSPVAIIHESKNFDGGSHILALLCDSVPRYEIEERVRALSSCYKKGRDRCIMRYPVFGISLGLLAIGVIGCSGPSMIKVIMQCCN